MDYSYSQPEDNKMVRTQISLPRGLKRQIEAAKHPQQSLADYLREAVTLKMKIDKTNKQREREERKKLAKIFIGSLDLSKHPEWSTPEKVIKWQKEMRAEWDRD